MLLYFLGVCFAGILAKGDFYHLPQHLSLCTPLCALTTSAQQQFIPTWYEASHKAAHRSGADIVCQPKGVPVKLPKQ